MKKTYLTLGMAAFFFGSCQNEPKQSVAFSPEKLNVEKQEIVNLLRSYDENIHAVSMPEISEDDRIIDAIPVSNSIRDSLLQVIENATLANSSTVANAKESTIKKKADLSKNDVFIGEFRAESTVYQENKYRSEEIYFVDTRNSAANLPVTFRRIIKNDTDTLIYGYCRP